MARVKVSPDRRAAGRHPTPLLATSLALGLLAALAVAPAWASAAVPDVHPIAAVTEQAPDPEPDPETTPAQEPTPTEEPGGDPVPTDPPPATTAPPPETTPPAPQTSAPDVPPAPTTAAPPPGGTTRPPTLGRRPPVPPVHPPAPGGTEAPPPSPLGVQVTTEDVTLTEAYWNAASTATTLRVTVANTGTAAQRLRLSYTLPAGLTDAGTKGCVAAGGGVYHCGAWTTEAGARFSSLIRVRVAGNAWEQMPLERLGPGHRGRAGGAGRGRRRPGLRGAVPTRPSGARDLAGGRRGRVRHQRRGEHPGGPVGQHRHGGRRRPGRGASCRPG